MATINYYYTKSVLETVSENPLKFKKALQHAKRSLMPFEIEHLTKWLISFTLNKPELKTFFNDEKITLD
jgi:DNA replication protein DnaD